MPKLLELQPIKPSFMTALSIEPRKERSMCQLKAGGQILEHAISPPQGLVQERRRWRQE